MLVVQWIEHLVAVQAVGGSIPLEHTQKERSHSWSSALVSKTGIPKGIVGPNPTLSADYIDHDFYLC